jgi:hypothetical protein
MTTHCLICGKSIETEDDEHYYCSCKDVYKAVCPHDALDSDKCPDCGDRLQYYEASITKRLFEEPGMRGLLDF